MKYLVYAIINASKCLGEFEAESREDAIEIAEKNANVGGLCHQCAGKIEIGDIDRFEAEQS